MTAPLRGVVIGCGSISHAHAEALQGRDDAALVGGVDPVDNARGAFGTRWAVPTFPSIEAALEATHPDFAIVCTPPAAHRPSVERLLDLGLHVLCEKPLALTVTDVRAMLKAARRRGRVLAGSTKFRYVPELEETARRIGAGEIGDPVFAEVTLCAPVAFRGKWMADPQRSGGGVVMDNGNHAIDILSRAVTAPIARVAAGFGRGSRDPEVEETAEILFTTADGLLGRIALSWTYFTKDLDYLMVQGTEGGIRVGWTGGQFRRHGDRDWTAFGEAYDKRLAFRRQLDAFVGRVRGAVLSDPHWDPVATATVLQRVYEAQRSGRWRLTRRARATG